jgi:hypothetical protein
LFCPQNWSSLNCLGAEKISSGEAPLVFVD